MVTPALEIGPVESVAETHSPSHFSVRIYQTHTDVSNRNVDWQSTEDTVGEGVHDAVGGGETKGGGGAGWQP